MWAVLIIVVSHHTVRLLFASHWGRHSRKWVSIRWSSQKAQAGAWRSHQLRSGRIQGCRRGCQGPVDGTSRTGSSQECNRAKIYRWPWKALKGARKCRREGHCVHDVTHKIPQAPSKGLLYYVQTLLINAIFFAFKYNYSDSNTNNFIRTYYIDHDFLILSTTLTI